MYHQQEVQEPGRVYEEAPTCPYRAGLERHLVPSGDDHGIVTKATSNQVFGSSGLGFVDGIWARLISWLARNGIQEQTGSKPDETSIENCVNGWGQGPYSSRVFNVDQGVDQEQLERFIAHLAAIANELGAEESRFTARVLAAFVEAQAPQAYSTWKGLRTLHGWRSRLGARFRAHIQWQAFVELCGVLDDRNVKHVTPNLVREFFNSEEPFFERVMDRRRRLRAGQLENGAAEATIAPFENWVDPVATDAELRRNKSGFGLVARILGFMWRNEGAGLPPLTTALPGTPTHQYSMTLAVPVPEAKVDSLRKLLARVNEEVVDHMRDPSKRGRLPLHEVASLHYARFVLVEASPEHGDPALLVFASNFDGPIGAAERNEEQAGASHVRELVHHLAEGLDEIYGHAEGYQAGSEPRALVEYLSDPRHEIPAQTFYVGASGRSRSQIEMEAELREKVEEAADKVARTSKEDDPEKLRDAIIEELRAMKVELPPPFPEQPDGEPRIRRALWLAGAGALLTLPISLPTIGLLYLTLRIKEKWLDKPELPGRDEAARRRIIELTKRENQFMQNQLTHLIDLKPGWFRVLAIKLVFSVLQFLATYRYNKGSLGNIPSIHFARWVFLGKKRRVLFFSNFDNSWQSYLGDFVDQAANGLTAVWSNTLGYPRTKNLASAGARNATSFLAWTRAHQLPTDVWFSAYPALSIDTINFNTLLRRGLADKVSVPPATWLRVLGGEDTTRASGKAPDAIKPPAPSELPVHDIQGIILKGYGFLEYASFIMLRVIDAGPARRWLARLPLTSASRASAEHYPTPEQREGLTFLNVAFTHAGLEALGADRTLLGGFPADFAMGSHKRARILGDFGKSAPEKWQWGNDEHPVHILLMVYCYSEEKLRDAKQKYEAEAQTNGCQALPTLNAGRLPRRKEHFGFRDGIAQPTIRNNPLTASMDDGNSVAPGEFLLGFPDGYRTGDDDRYEKSANANIAFAPETATGFEFCRGGSYLVFRQLEQNVLEFWRFCEETSRSSGSGLSPVAVASKLVGRWPNGEPLVLHPKEMSDPAQDSKEADAKNDAFDYAKSGDLRGERCPFGAHIRRTNPRDWLMGSHPEESSRLANLHRIIRRGRPYGSGVKAVTEPDFDGIVPSDADDSGSRGLHFLCFNANIERQFEFIQQHWVNNPQVGGLHADADPLTALHDRPEQMPKTSTRAFTIQSHPIRHRCTGLSEFVAVKGSAYFLMPPIAAVRHMGKW